MGLARHSDVATPKRSCGPHRSLVPRQRLQKIRHLRNCVDTYAHRVQARLPQGETSIQQSAISSQ